MTPRAMLRYVLRPSPRLMEWVRAVGRVRTIYEQHHHRRLSLLRPGRFSEKMQWRKLFDLNPLYGILSDKLAARAFIRDRVGLELLVPLLWAGDDPDAIPFDALVPPYVIKSSHAAGHVIRVTENDIPDQALIRATTRSWLAHCHGSAMDEPGYICVPRQLLVERLLLTKASTPPIERKLFVFDGKVRLIQTVTVRRDSERFCSCHDRNVRIRPAPQVGAAA